MSKRVKTSTCQKTRQNVKRHVKMSKGKSKRQKVKTLNMSKDTHPAQASKRQNVKTHPGQPPLPIGKSKRQNVKISKDTQPRPPAHQEVKTSKRQNVKMSKHTQTGPAKIHCQRRSQLNNILIKP